MLKTLKMISRQEKEKLKVPRSVQDLIPVRTVYPDGIFEVSQGKYSRTYRFDDINYAVASGPDKDSMFLKYSEILNSLDSGAVSKITVNNRRMDRREIARDILLPSRNDRLDEYRKEYNRILLEKALSTTSMVQDKYLTISVFKNSIEDARTYFARVGAEFQMHFSKLGSRLTELEAEERLKILFDFYRIGEESSFNFDMEDYAKKGHGFKDYISPDSIEVSDDFFMMGEKFGRVMFLKDYAAYLKDDIVTKLTNISRNLMLSIDIIPIPTDEAVREVENRMLGVETNAANWQRRQNANNNFTAMLPYDMELQRKETKEFLEDLTTRDQKMMFALVTVVHMADTKKQLDEDTEAIKTAARERMCQLATLKWQQMDGLNTALPIGVRKIDVARKLTTESLAVLMPFRVQEISYKHGIYYGQNAISKNMIVADRQQLMNGNSFIVGVSGSGKSFAGKNEIVNLMLADDCDVILLDPEREYSSLVRAMGGEVIHISATSPNHINAMDLNKEYGDGANPVILKSEFVLSLCEQLIGSQNLGGKAEVNHRQMHCRYLQRIPEQRI